MNKNKVSDWNSRFKAYIRLTEIQKEWLRKHSGKKSMAGFLEDIINKEMTKKKYDK